MSEFAIDDASDFSPEALGVPAPPEGTPGDTDTGQADTAQQGRLRNERGQFVAAEQEGGAEPQGAPELDPAVQPLLDKYGGDINRTLQAALEAQQLIGRQGAELAALRQAVEAQAYQQNLPSYDYSNIAEEDPAKAVQLAYDNGDAKGFNVAFQVLKDYDPTAAEVWRMRLEQQMLQQRVEAQLQQLGSSQQQQVLDQNLAQLAARYPDLPQYQGAISGVLNDYPGIKMMLESGDPGLVVQALEVSYQAAKARASETLGQAAQQVAQAQAQANEQALQGAFVASANTTVRQDTQPTVADQLWDEWQKIPDSLGWGK